MYLTHKISPHYARLEKYYSGAVIEAFNSCYTVVCDDQTISHCEDYIHRLTKPCVAKHTAVTQNETKNLFFSEISVAVSIIQLLTPGFAFYGNWMAEHLLKAITGSL